MHFSYSESQTTFIYNNLLTLAINIMKGKFCDDNAISVAPNYIFNQVIFPLEILINELLKPLVW